MDIGQRFTPEGALKPSSIEWDGYEQDLSAHRVTDIPTDMQAKYVYDGDGNILYVGYSARGLSDSATGWLIHSFTYTNNVVTSRSIIYGRWSDYSGTGGTPSQGIIQVAGTVIVATPTFIGDNFKNVTVAGTREMLSTTVYCIKVIITAKEANTGDIWIGGETIAAGRGRPLKALQSQEIEIDDLSKIWIDATVSGEGVTYTYDSFRTFFLTDDDGNIVYDGSGNPVIA